MLRWAQDTAIHMHYLLYLTSTLFFKFNFHSFEKFFIHNFKTKNFRKNKHDSSFQSSTYFSWDSQHSAPYNFHADPSLDDTYQAEDDLICFKSANFVPHQRFKLGAMLWLLQQSWRLWSSEVYCYDYYTSPEKANFNTSHIPSVCTNEFHQFYECNQLITTAVVHLQTTCKKMPVTMPVSVQNVFNVSDQ